MKASKEGPSCPKCNKLPVKPAIIFEDYDLGDCHDVCLVCSMIKLPLMAGTLDITTSMMDEMQGISDVLDELMVAHELYQAGEEEKAKQVNIKGMQIEAKTPEQVIARKVLEALQYRKAFLEDIDENEGLKNLADTFIRLLQKN